MSLLTRTLLALALYLLPTVLPTMTAAEGGAQVPAAQQAQARVELARLGVDEGALRQRLLQRGIDVDAMGPAELAANRPQIEAAVAERDALELEHEALHVVVFGDRLDVE